MSKTLINQVGIALFLLTHVFVNNLVFANEQKSVSFGIHKKELNHESRFNIIKTNIHSSITDQLTGKATGKTRTEIINQQQKSVNNVKETFASNSKSHSYTADFSIYGATSLLLEDYDGDGFYRTFSVVFDADIYSYTHNQLGEVYALLYISKNGGPWTHYFTTDDFLIEGDTDLDEYEVITTFLSGYSTDYYDVLIDLYQVGYSEIVASYSSDDSNALYALSLESADYDQPYIEIIETSGGSTYWLIMCLFSTYFIRLKMQKPLISATLG